MTVLIVGLGLIGGSYAKALKAKTGHTVLGLDNNPEVIVQALKSGSIDRAAAAEDLKTADLIILALYPAQTVEFITGHARDFGFHPLVIDSCGVKETICRSVYPLAARHGFRFVGTHPMAGKEKGGFESSDAGLFDGARFIITPERPKSPEIETLCAFAVELGFTKCIVTSPARHDEMIAYTSQLPHILACAYIFDERAKEHDGFSAGSFRDVSRVAQINEVMWTQLFMENREPLSQQISGLIKNLSLLKDAVDAGDSKTMTSLLRKGRLIKEEITP